MRELPRKMRAVRAQQGKGEQKMKVLYVNKDHSAKFYHTKAEDFELHDNPYFYDQDAVIRLEQKIGIDDRLIIYIEGDNYPVNLFKKETPSDVNKNIKTHLVSEKISQIKAQDMFKDLRRQENIPYWVFIAIIAILAVMNMLQTLW